MNNIGITVKPPTGVCEDALCPFHGSLVIRGRTITGKAVSVKGVLSSVIEREYLHFIKKYQRYEKRRSRTHAHLPSCIEVKEGDTVTIGECRHLAKGISFVVIGKEN